MCLASLQISAKLKQALSDCRAFYDVQADEVYVLRILSKEDVDAYLKEMGYEVENGER